MSAPVATTAATTLTWAEVENGMLTIQGAIIEMDRRFTVDGAVKVVFGSGKWTIFYDDETVVVFGRAF